MIAALSQLAPSDTRSAVCIRPGSGAGYGLAERAAQAAKEGIIVEELIHVGLRPLGAGPLCDGGGQHGVMGVYPGAERGDHAIAALSVKRDGAR